MEGEITNEIPVSAVVDMELGRRLALIYGGGQEEYFCFSRHPIITVALNY